MRNRLKIEQQRLDMSRAGVKSQIAPQEAASRPGARTYGLARAAARRPSREGARWTASFSRCRSKSARRSVPAPTSPASPNPTKLKAEVRIAETQTKDIRIGQQAEVDTRNGIIKGRVSRIDPSATGGTVGVDITLEEALPAGARPDLSVDGTITLEKLDNVVYVGRPAFGQEHSTVQLFKLDGDDRRSRTACRSSSDAAR